MNDRLNLIEEILVVECTLIEARRDQRAFVVIGDKSGNRLAMDKNVLLQFVQLLSILRNPRIHVTGGNNRAGQRSGEGNTV